MKHGTPQYGRSSPAYCRYCMRVEFQQYLMEGKLGGADELLIDSVSTFWPSQIQFDLLDAIDLKHEECHHPSSKCTIHCVYYHISIEYTTIYLYHPLEYIIVYPLSTCITIH